MAEHETRDGRVVETNDGRVVETRSSTTPVWLILILVVVALIVAAFGFGFVKIDQTKSAKLPDVKVQTSGGQAPAFDVNTATVDVGTKTETVQVPTVSVTKADEKK